MLPGTIRHLQVHGLEISYTHTQAQHCGPSWGAPSRQRRCSQGRPQTLTSVGIIQNAGNKLLDIRERGVLVQLAKEQLGQNSLLLFAKSLARRHLAGAASEAPAGSCPAPGSGGRSSLSLKGTCI